MFSLGWVELNDRHFIEEVTIVALFVVFQCWTVCFQFLACSSFLRLDVVLFQEIFVHFCTALRTLLCSCLTGLVYRNTIGN